MKNPRNIEAVSEILGEIILLAISVTSISVIAIWILGAPGPTDIANVTIIGQIEEGCPVFELQRGESLGPDTKIIIKLAGLEQTEFLQKDIIGNQEWNIGERIVLPSVRSVGDKILIQVEAKIVDTKTNSIVFWGLLQEGLTVKYKGGIWHFNESSWNGNYNEVIDSSGHNNHGRARGGATTTPNGPSPNCSNAGFFDGINDYVKVNTSWTLDITRSITLEAWMKTKKPDFQIDVSPPTETFGYNPDLIPVADDLYVQALEEFHKGCNISTYEIDPEGLITFRHGVTIGSSTADNICQPSIIYMRGRTFFVSFIDATLSVYMQTINISTDGSITLLDNLISTEKCDKTYPNHPRLLKITDSVCAIAYWATNSNRGILKTVEILSNGTIKDIEIKTYQTWYHPCLVHVTGDVYAVAYRSSSNQSILKTFNITSDGNITYTGKMLIFETGSAYEPDLIHVSGNIFAVAYRNNLLTNVHYGYIKTFKITSNGSIVWTGNTMVFENTLKCFDPCIIHGEDNTTFVIVYSTDKVQVAGAKGYVLTLHIDQNGLISPNDPRKQIMVPLPNGQFDDTCHSPIIIRIGEKLYAISFTGSQAHKGYLTTIYVGDYSRGIYKGDSYMLYADTTMVVGKINNVKVFNTSISPDKWYHFALTYDGMKIRLYINGNETNNVSYENHLIKVTTSPLYFGRFYCGYIDEIALYDKALTQKQIYTHYKTPGIFEYSSLVVSSYIS